MSHECRIPPASHENGTDDNPIPATHRHCEQTFALFHGKYRNKQVSNESAEIQNIINLFVLKDMQT